MEILAMDTNGHHSTRSVKCCKSMLEKKLKNYNKLLLFNLNPLSDTDPSYVIMNVCPEKITY